MRKIEKFIVIPKNIHPTPIKKGMEFPEERLGVHLAKIFHVNSLRMSRNSRGVDSTLNPLPGGKKGEKGVRGKGLGNIDIFWYHTLNHYHYHYYYKKVEDYPALQNFGISFVLLHTVWDPAVRF